MNESPGTLMTECPKCGFSQPEDRYCAQCGVDIASFEPPKPPFVTRLFSNWIFQLFLMAAAIAGSAYYLHEHREAQLQARLRALETAPATHAVQPKTAAAKRALGAAKLAAQKAESGANAPATGLSNSAAPPATANALDAKPATDAAPIAAIQPTKLRIESGEFAGAFLKDLVASAKNEQALNDETTGVANIDQPLVRFGKDLVSGISSDNKALTLAAPVHVTKTSSNGVDSTIGFAIQATPSSIDDGGVSLDVEIIRYLAPSATFGQSPNEQFSASFKIPPGHFAFMSGLLPRRGAPLDGAQRSLYANTPLSVLNSAQFQSSQTDFVLLFLPQ